MIKYMKTGALDKKTVPKHKIKKKIKIKISILLYLYHHFELKERKEDK